MIQEIILFMVQNYHVVKMEEKIITSVCKKDKGIMKCDRPSIKDIFVFGSGDVFEGEKYLGNVDINDPEIKKKSVLEIVNMLKK